MISRRDFLKGAGVAALAVATTGMLAGCSKDTPVTPDPAPDSKPSTGSTYALGQAIPVADGVTVTVTGKRYNYYTQEGEGNDNGGFIALKVSVKNDGDKAFAVKSTDFKLIQTDYKPRTQYPMNVKAYGVGNGTANADAAKGLEFLLTKFVGRNDPAMDEEPSYVLGTPGTELAAYLGFVTNAYEAEGTATLQYVVGDKVYKINF